mgnify:CR=1 FL=1
MTIQKTGLALLISAAVVCFAACSNTSAGADNAEMKPVPAGPNGYMKPGASVEFSTNFDGHAEPGETEVFQVVAREFYDAGTMIINISGSEGLDVRADAAGQSINMAGDATQTQIRLNELAHISFVVDDHDVGIGHNAIVTLIRSPIAVAIGMTSQPPAARFAPRHPSHRWQH